MNEKQIIEAALQFMQRVNLSGQEVQAFITCQNYLAIKMQEITQQEGQQEECHKKGDNQ